MLLGRRLRSLRLGSALLPSPQYTISHGIVASEVTTFGFQKLPQLWDLLCAGLCGGTGDFGRVKQVPSSKDWLGEKPTGFYMDFFKKIGFSEHVPLNQSIDRNK